MTKFLHTIAFIFDTSKLPVPLKRFMNNGIKISFILLLFSTLLMALYIDFMPSNNLFRLSSLLIKSTSTFIVSFIVFGAGFNRLLKEKRP